MTLVDQVIELASALGEAEFGMDRAARVFHATLDPHEDKSVIIGISPLPGVSVVDVYRRDDEDDVDYVVLHLDVEAQLPLEAYEDKLGRGELPEVYPPHSQPDTEFIVFGTMYRCTIIARVRDATVVELVLRRDRLPSRT